MAAKKLVIAILRFYKKYFSPIMPPACRYTPTCSEYTVLAVEKYGVVKGLWKGVLRILRCNPLGGSGVDMP